MRDRDRDATSDSPEDALLRQARRRVRLKTGFLTHLLVYVLVNLGLFLLNASVGGPHWHQFPLLGWGIGLAIHGIVTFFSLSGDDWRQRMLDSEVRRLRERQR
ncbi:MAG TPA: 2TM domain-containing protein [Ideonella sp.]|uniref:2TM domain-containing protein n=1 Tax=Ideonella sp. TaxID=1929293 RepID=UPI002C85C58E|nr:2TM domain-containing protein [Ideonella sp.]HSI52230.1 2TM domain-containing protein [Ideonella sp.]